MEERGISTPVPAHAETELRSRVRADAMLGSGAAILPPSPDLARQALPRTGQAHQTRVIDVPQRIIHQPRDLVDAITHFGILAVVLLLAVFGQETAAGVTEDVVDVVNATARQVLLLPIAVLEGLVVFAVPVMVLALHLVRRQWRPLIEAVLAAAIAATIALTGSHLLEMLGPTYAITVGLTQVGTGAPVAAFSATVAAIAAMLSVVGRSSSSRLIRWSWTALGVIVVLAVIQRDQTLAGAIITLLFGRAIGLLARFIGGARSTRARGVSLVAGLRRAGFSPDLVLRLDADDALTASIVTSGASVGHNTPLTIEPSPASTPIHSASIHSAPNNSTAPAPLTPLDSEVPDPLPLGPEVERILCEPSRHDGPWRRYAVIAGTRRLDAQVLDDDRQVLGVLSSLWEQFRLRGIERPRTSTVQEAAEHGALMSLAAAELGVRVPRISGLAQSGDSIVLVRDHAADTVPLVSVPPSAITDAVADEVWAQIRRAHDAGLAHRSIDATALLLDGEGRVWVDRWDSGSIASSELARRMDGVQTLVTLALLIGEERAISSASRALATSHLAELAPLLQRVVLTAHTAASLKRARKLLPRLRERLGALIPTVADIEPQPIQRFTLTQALSAVVLLGALVILFGTFSWSDIVRAFRHANPWWLVGAFLAGLSTYLGAAIGLKAFTQETLGLWRTTLVQVASSIVSLVAPAGVGPAAVDLRYLTREKVPVALAAATVTLTQVSRILTTVALLLVVTVASGSTSPGGGITPASAIPVLVGVVVALAIVGGLVAMPRIRAWVAQRVRPILRQIWPRVVWVVSSPVRLILGISGNALQAVGYVAAFGMTLAAFGHSLPISTLAITYLVSQSAGSMIPSPAGIGPVEVALTSGLALAGVPSGIALSATIVFRVLTLLARIPIGWVALKYLQSRHVL